MEKEVQKPYTRHNHGHGAKRQLIGNQARQVPPAWRTNNIPTSQTTPASPKGKEVQGSRIFISGLPTDVREKEVEVGSYFPPTATKAPKTPVTIKELFKKTVGPLKEVFIVYNSHSSSKGMAVVTFQRPGDAVLARNKYHGKIVDGRTFYLTSISAVIHTFIRETYQDRNYARWRPSAFDSGSSKSQ